MPCTPSEHCRACHIRGDMTGSATVHLPCENPQQESRRAREKPCDDICSQVQFSWSQHHQRSANEHRKSNRCHKERVAPDVGRQPYPRRLRRKVCTDKVGMAMIQFECLGFCHTLGFFLAADAIELDRFIFKSRHLAECRDSTRTQPKNHECRDDSSHGRAPKIDADDCVRQHHCRRCALPESANRNVCLLISRFSFKWRNNGDTGQTTGRQHVGITAQKQKVSATHEARGRFCRNL